MKKRADGRWQKKITLPNGKSKMLYSSEPSERMAIKDFNEQLMHIEKESTESELFEKIAEQWKEEHFPSLQNNTLKQYKPCYEQAIKHFSGCKIKDITPKHIFQYINTLKRLGFAQKTIKNRMLVISLIFQYAVINDYTDSNPTFKITVPKNLKQTKRENASKDDENKICNSTNSLCGVLAYLYLTTGCRRGEAVALTPKDINITEKNININKTVEWIGNKPQIKDSPKTESGKRTIPVSEKLIELLKPYMKQKYIFQNKKGELIDNSQLTRMWNNYQKEIGISCTPHQLRHSYATILFDAGIDVKTAQLWLGHADIKTTLGIYTHLSQYKQSESINKLQNFLTTF